MVEAAQIWHIWLFELSVKLVVQLGASTIIFLLKGFMPLETAWRGGDSMMWSLCSTICVSKKCKQKTMSSSHIYYPVTIFIVGN